MKKGHGLRIADLGVCIAIGIGIDSDLEPGVGVLAPLAMESADTNSIQPRRPFPEPSVFICGHLWIKIFRPINPDVEAA
jgi:hypothetical protein